MDRYDILMLAVLVGTTLFGAYKGMAWQVASLGALILSYFVSLKFSEPLTATGLFGVNAPWNRFAAMLAIYLFTGAVVWFAFRVVSQTIDKIRLRDFDHQLGALFGACKGVLFCVGITFFTVTVVPAYREHVLSTHSGRYIGQLLVKADAVMPPELHQLLDPYLQPLERELQPQPGAAAQPPAQPIPWNARMEQPLQSPANQPSQPIGGANPSGGVIPSGNADRTGRGGGGAPGITTEPYFDPRFALPANGPVPLNIEGGPTRPGELINGSRPPAGTSNSGGSFPASSGTP